MCVLKGGYTRRLTHTTRALFRSCRRLGASPERALSAGSSGMLSLEAPPNSPAPAAASPQVSGGAGGAGAGGSSPTAESQVGGGARGRVHSGRSAWPAPGLRDLTEHATGPDTPASCPARPHSLPPPLTHTSFCHSLRLCGSLSATAASSTCWCTTSRSCCRPALACCSGRLACWTLTTSK